VLKTNAIFINIDFSIIGFTAKQQLPLNPPPNAQCQVLPIFDPHSNQKPVGHNRVSVPLSAELCHQQ
jgi:hypothetical protein